MTIDFQYLSPGLTPELDALTLDELCQHYKTHYSNFVLDENIGSYYFKRFAEDVNLAKHSEAIACFMHVTKSLHLMDPFNVSVGNVMLQLAYSPLLKMRLKILSHMSPGNNFLQSITRLISAGNVDNARTKILRELSVNPGNVFLGVALYELDVEHGIRSHDWLPSFAPHKELLLPWQQRVAYLAAKGGRVEEALTHFHALPEEYRTNELLLNAIASCSLLQNDTSTAHMLLETSLKLTPSQLPIQYCKDELDNPFSVDSNSLDGRNIVVAIYSYNKADLLEETLKSLSKSYLGMARCVVLLNGCTDHSLQVVEEAKALFTTTELETIVMPVNIGAPAARNYLVNYALSDSQTELVAFLDDDVTIDSNWLAALVTAIDEDSQVGAVGCKVTNPDSTLQYLFRDVSIARPGIFRLSLGRPMLASDNGLYNVRRDVDSVMGCCHLIRRECLEKVPEFDIRFSPSQLDDVAFHLDLRLLGYKVRYVGQVTCCHNRSTGFAGQSRAAYGNSLGNDVKFYYRFEESLPTLREWQEKRNQYAL